MIAEKKIAPMIVVMPWGHAVPFAAPRAEQVKNTALFEDYLLHDVIPMVESKYRALTDHKNRAIAGLSMGGGQSLTIGFDHLDLFSSIAAFSAAVPNDFETRFAAALSNPKETNAKLNLLWIGCGKQDSLLARAQKLSEVLKAHHIQHVFRESEGNHTYTVWRQYLIEIAPRLFGQS
jgi:enterochelin esterase-like enzyme